MFSLKNVDLIDPTTASVLSQFVTELRQWLLVEHNSDGTLQHPPAALISDLGLPVGTTVPYAGSSVPTGWLLCDGAAISRVTYFTLFSVISTFFGVGDGATTFNLPDLQGRFPLGKATAGTGAVLGSSGGAIDHTHTGPAHTHTIASEAAHTHTGPSHTHTISSSGTHTHTGPSHTHSIASDGTGATGVPSATVNVEVAVVTPVAVGTNTHTHTGPAHDHGAATGAGGTGATGAGGDHDHTGATGAGGTGATGSSGAHDHTGVTGTAGAGTTSTANPPFQVFNYIILYA